MLNTKLVSLALVMLVLSTSCIAPFGGRYTNPPLIEVIRRSPEEDFSRLEALFKREGGNLITTNDVVVKWKDTCLCRLFEFRDHSVMVFPFDWNEHCYDIFLYSGHSRQYDDISLITWPSSRPSRMFSHYYVNTMVRLSSNISCSSHIGLRGHFLGMGWDQTKHFVETYNTTNAAKIKSLIIEPGYKIDGVYENGSERDLCYYGTMTFPDNLSVDMFYQNGKSYFIRYIGGAFMSGYLSRSSSLPVVDEGEFSLAMLTNAINGNSHVKERSSKCAK